MDHDLGAAAQRLVGDGVHVADDEVGLPAGLDDRVGAAVDPDEDRAELLDVGAQRLEVFAVVVPADDDEHLASGDLGRDRGDPDTVEQQVALASEVVHGVRREGLELGRESLAGFFEVCTDLLGVLQHSLGHEGVAEVHGAVLDPQRLALADRHDVGTEVVDEHDPRVDQDARAEVRVASRDRLRGVEHSGGLGGDERLGSHTVDVEVVDHGDVAGA